MLRSLTTFSLPGLAPVKFRENGFLYWEDVCHEKGFTKDALKIVQQINLQDSFEILTEIPATRSALEIWQEECSTTNIVTFCEELDVMLDGGVSLGQVTELSGAPGSGKTQMCLQLCVDVHIPESLGGVGGKALYIDSSLGFSPTRLKELATACVRHCRAVDTDILNLTTETIMNRTYCIVVNDHIELIAAVESVEQMLQTVSQAPERELHLIDNHIAAAFKTFDYCFILMFPSTYKEASEIAGYRQHHISILFVGHQLPATHQAARNAPGEAQDASKQVHHRCGCYKPANNKS